MQNFEMISCLPIEMLDTIFQQFTGAELIRYFRVFYDLGGHVREAFMARVRFSVTSVRFPFRRGVLCAPFYGIVQANQRLRMLHLDFSRRQLSSTDRFILANLNDLGGVEEFYLESISMPCTVTVYEEILF